MEHVTNKCDAKTCINPATHTVDPVDMNFNQVCEAHLLPHIKWLVDTVDSTKFVVKRIKENS
jgi:hypothetical protein